MHTNYTISTHFIDYLHTQHMLSKRHYIIYTHNTCYLHIVTNIHKLHYLYTLPTQAGACLQYGGRLLEQLFRARPRRCAPAAVFPAPAVAASLWSAKLFTAHTSMSESFKHTVQLVSCLLSQVCSSVIHYSYLLSVI